ncbi:MAG TPA: hypothetical protein VFP80_01065 [Thermoanaerobaculia bacterium]|nr:hypothetical protein [Thermoanaerobaculia bacterium]
MMELIPIFGILSSSTMVVLIVYFVSRSKARRAEVQAEVQSRLIDRFGSAPELIDFLQSPAGRQFVTGVQSAPALLARERILSGFSRAIVLSMLGAAFLALTFWYNDDFAVPASILFSLGIGYLLATFVTWRLSRHLNGGDVLNPSADQTARS